MISLHALKNIMHDNADMENRGGLMETPAKYMKQWACPVCSYEHTGNRPPDICPNCEYEDDEWLEEVAG